MTSKNLIILFPGSGYTVNHPLLFYARFKYRAKGYECISIDYGDCVRKDLTLDEVIENIKTFILSQVKVIDFSSYNDIIFVSKSIGTTIAGWLAARLQNNNIRHIYLTPLEQTLQYIAADKNIGLVVCGTKDKLMPADILEGHCNKANIKLKLIAHVGHNLEIPGDAPASIEILKQIVKAYP